MKNFAIEAVSEIEASASRQLKSAAVLVVGIKLGKLVYRAYSK